MATETLEPEGQRSIDAIVVPVGGGCGAAGTCIVAKAPAAKHPSHRRAVLGRPRRVPVLVRSGPGRGRDGQVCRRAATRTAFELPQRILSELLDDFVLVDDEELRVAVRAMIEQTRNLVEPAGAAPLAAAMRLGDQLSGRRIALICTGGNISSAQLRAILDH
jgi:threonine dehydratase